MSPVSTPCIKICVMGQPSGLCQGCGRTLDEIGCWASLAEEERLAIMDQLPGRLATAGRTNRRRASRPAL
jgi:predicted Fe-S protein YdhL (DUF1289 family)